MSEVLIRIFFSKKKLSFEALCPNSLSVSKTQIADLVQLVTSTDNPADLFCSPGRLHILEYLNVPPGAVSSNVDSLQEILCKSGKDGGRLLQLLLNNTDLLRLIDQVWPCQLCSHGLQLSGIGDTSLLCRTLGLVTTA